MAYEGSDHRPLISYFEPEKKKRPGLFRYDRPLKDNPEVKELVHQALQRGANQTVNDRIVEVRSALIEWSKQQYRNSRALIEEKKFELEKALTDPLNDTTLITKVTEELNAAYASEE